MVSWLLYLEPLVEPGGVMCSKHKGGGGWGGGGVIIAINSVGVRLKAKSPTCHASLYH